MCVRWFLIAATLRSGVRVLGHKLYYFWRSTQNTKLIAKLTAKANAPAAAAGAAAAAASGAGTGLGSFLRSGFKRGVQVWLLLECVFGVYHKYQMYTLQKPNPPPQTLTDADRERHLTRMLDADALIGQDHAQYLRQWFKGAALNDIRDENTRDFLLFAWWPGRTWDSLTAADQRYFEDIRLRLQKQSGIVPEPGRTPHVAPMKISLDPYHAWHRPLALYFVIRCVRTLTGLLLRRRGFTYHTVNGGGKTGKERQLLQYWYRPQLDSTGAVARVDYSPLSKAGIGRSAAADAKHPKPLTPIVLVHGVGVGAFPYVHFIDRVSRVCGSASSTAGGSSAGGGGRNRSSPPMYVLHLPYISMDMDAHVPTMEQHVSAITDMLTRHGVTAQARKVLGDSAVLPIEPCPQRPVRAAADGAPLHPDGAMFVGHSFGTIVSGWMTKQRPQLVHGVCLIDPVVYLLHKPDVCYNFCYRAPTSPGQLMIHFFASTELYILHTMQRHFWWWEQILWADDCPGNGRTRVVLGSKDQLVPVDAVRQYLRHKGVAVTWLDNCRHAQFLAHRGHFRAAVHTCAELYEAVVPATRDAFAAAAAAAPRAAV